MKNEVKFIAVDKNGIRKEFGVWSLKDCWYEINDYKMPEIDFNSPEEFYDYVNRGIDNGDYDDVLGVMIITDYILEDEMEVPVKVYRNGIVVSEINDVDDWR